MDGVIIVSILCFIVLRYTIKFYRKKYLFLKDEKMKLAKQVRISNYMEEYREYLSNPINTNEIKHQIIENKIERWCNLNYNLKTSPRINQLIYDERR